MRFSYLAVVHVLILANCSTVWALKCTLLSQPHPLGKVLIYPSTSQRIFERLLQPLQRLRKGEESFGIEDIAYVFRVTPQIFKARPKWIDPQKRVEELRKYAREQMSEREAQAIFRYFREEGIYRWQSSFHEMISAFKIGEGYVTNRGESIGAFEFRRNLEEGLRVLEEFDFQHGTHYALRARWSVILNYHRLAPLSFGHRHFKAAAEAAITSPRSESISEFFKALSEARSPEGFFGLRNAELYLRSMFEKVLSGEAAPPDSAIVDKLIEIGHQERLDFARSQLTFGERDRAMKTAEDLLQLKDWYFSQLESQQ